MADTDSTKDRKTKAAQKTIKNSSKREKQRRAIIGQHSEQQRYQYFCLIIGDLENRLPGIELPNQYASFDEDDIAAGVQKWIENTTDDAVKHKVFKLKEDTKRYLARKVPGWRKIFRQIKQRVALPDDIKGAIRHVLEERAHTRLCQIEHYYEISLDEAFEYVFTDPDHYEQDRRIGKIRRDLLKQLKAEMELVPAWLDQDWPLEKKDRWPSKWILNDPEIMENLNRKGCQYFFKLMELLWDHRLSPKGSGWTEEKVLFTRNDALLAEKLGANPYVVAKYMRELERCKIITRMGRCDQRGAFVYAIGTWSFKGKFPKPDKFIKDTPEWRGVLKGFDPYRKG